MVGSFSRYINKKAPDMFFGALALVLIIAIVLIAGSLGNLRVAHLVFWSAVFIVSLAVFKPAFKGVPVFTL